MFKASTLCVLVTGGVLATNTALAAPTFDAFGPLPQATFGGTGIPNDEVAAGIQFTDGANNTITVALSATQRFFNPALTNDGAGTYFAGPGSNNGGPGSVSPTIGALWNFNYYIEVAGTKTIADYQFDLYYDFNPADNTPLGSLGRIDITDSVAAFTPGASVTQGSQNLLFSFLGNPPVFPTLITPPAGAFDPNALGQYTFAILVSDPSSGFPVEAVSINVEVVPEPSSLALVGLAGVLALSRRRR